MTRQVLVDLTDKPILDGFVIMFAQLAQCCRGRCDNELLEVTGQGPFAEHIRRLSGKAIFFQLMEIGLADRTGYAIRP